jgi:hypothetical protein
MKWMLISVMAPEVVMVMAAGQWSIAYASYKEMGVILREREKQCDEAEIKGEKMKQTRRRNGENHERWSLRHAFYADMGGFHLIDKKGDKYVLRSRHVTFLVHHHYIDLPSLTTMDIKDRSKSDSLAKAFACLQICWLATQCIARAAQRLAVTTLEIATLSFIICTIGTYIFWLRKPYNISTSTIINMPDYSVDEINLEVKSDDEAQSLLERYRELQPRDRNDNVLKPDGTIAPSYTKLDIIDDARPNWTKDFTNTIRWWRGGKEKKEPRIRNDRLPANSFMVTLCSAFISFSYAGLHVTAWNISFPTHVERLLWRTISLSLLGSIVTWWILDIAQALDDIAKKKKGQTVPKWRLITSVGVAFVYGVSRAYLIVEAFVGLRGLPPGAYKSVDWSAFVPHI